MKKTGQDSGGLTPAQVERLLARGFDHVRATAPAAALMSARIDTRDEYKEARATWAAFRVANGAPATSAVPAILSEDIGKTQKNDRRTYALAFLPHDTSGLANVCAFEDRCAATCVAFSGKGDMAEVRHARRVRLAFAIEHPRAFAWILAGELLKINATQPDTLVRLNAYSDLRWERVARWIFDACDRVTFYDYTKHTTRSRPADTVPTNYRLTYSVSTRSTLEHVQAAAAAGRNPAVVFAARANSRTHELPPTWAGMPVIDGDTDDDRAADPVGVVVGLRRKGSLAAGADLVTAGERIDRAAARQEAAR